MVVGSPPESDYSGGGICVSVAAPDAESAAAQVRKVIDRVDVVEIRLDAMHSADMSVLSSGISRPLLLTNRPAWEGGNFSGSEQDRLQSLLDAIPFKPSFIDLELKVPEENRRQLLVAISGKATRMIISHHDFSMTPDYSTLSEILRRQMESGAHIGKIVTLAHDHLDVLRVLQLQEEASRNNFPLIAFCMGEAGRVSRAVTLLLGGFMTYAALDGTSTTAPGQLTVQELCTVLISLGYLPRA